MCTGCLIRTFVSQNVIWHCLCEYMFFYYFVVYFLGWIFFIKTWQTILGWVAHIYSLLTNRAFLSLVEFNFNGRSLHESSAVFCLVNSLWSHVASAIHYVTFEDASCNPLCHSLSLHVCLRQTEKDLQHPWRVTYAVRRWLWQVSAVVQHSRNSHTLQLPPLLLLLTVYTANDSIEQFYLNPRSHYYDCYNNTIKMTSHCHWKWELHYQCLNACSSFSLCQHNVKRAVRVCVCVLSLQREGQRAPPGVSVLFLPEPTDCRKTFLQGRR